LRIIGRAAGGADLADLADIAEQLLEEAAVATQGRGLLVGGVDRGDLFQPLLVHRGDVAGFVEADVENGLLVRTRLVEAVIAVLAGDIIPVTLVELADEAGAAKRRDDRIAIVGAGLDRGDQRLIDQLALMVAHLGAGGGGEKGGAEQHRQGGALSEAGVHA
jgi:hypothetical protein